MNSLKKYAFMLLLLATPMPAAAAMIGKIDPPPATTGTAAALAPVQLAEWQETKQNIKHSSKKAGREVGKGAKDFGKAVAKGAKTIGHETRRVGRSIKKGVKELFK